jgi:restriction system protein
MKLKMAENSLFAVLMRSPWWVSVLAALAVFGVVRLFMHEGYALFAASPFIVIALVAGWKRLRAPSGAKVAARLEALRGMPWEEFAAALEAGFRRDGYVVKRLEGGSTDFELVKDGRVSLVAAKRWKAAQTGIEPLRDLHAAGTERDCVYVLAGEMTQNAKTFAAEKKIRLVEAAELVRLIC